MYLNNIESIIEKMLNEAKSLRNNYGNDPYNDNLQANPDVATALENYAYQLESAVECLTISSQDSAR